MRFDSLVPLLLVGAGQMGRNHYRSLREGIGIRSEDIIVVDTKSSALDELCKQWSAPRATTSLESALGMQPKAAIIAASTPAHYLLIKKLVEQGVEHLLVEKPLVMPGQLLDGVFGLADVHVAYLINFSRTLQNLNVFLGENKLFVTEIDGQWGKDRTTDTRPTPGTLQDELTHIWGVAAYLLRNRPFLGADVSALLSHLPYVDMEVQRKMRAEDGSMSLRPDSRAHAAVRFYAQDGTSVLCTANSSFTRFEKTRRIELSIGDEVNPLMYAAQLDFDVQVGNDLHDQITIRAYGSKDALQVINYPASTKLTDMQHAWLEYADEDMQDDRLVDWRTGRLLVEIADACERSHRDKKVIEVL
ncbi:hypothetical protein COW95_02795 [Candidatus Peregrinibacteria bacterium CG22_combo_CG10-13_8_21_14_all_49_11]|nr:MAG: hypothetical protein COW95_02795 [Candidatus Peregrinibacteria bacterium CG22_combo_CG10-13_8_21_14_all_49_11]